MDRIGPPTGSKKYFEHALFCVREWNAPLYQAVCRRELSGLLGVIFTSADRLTEWPSASLIRPEQAVLLVIEAPAAPPVSLGIEETLRRMRSKLQGMPLGEILIIDTEWSYRLRREVAGPLDLRGTIIAGSWNESGPTELRTLAQRCSISTADVASSTLEEDLSALFGRIAQPESPCPLPPNKNFEIVGIT